MWILSLSSAIGSCNDEVCLVCFDTVNKVGQNCASTPCMTVCIVVPARHIKYLFFIRINNDAGEP